MTTTTTPVTADLDAQLNEMVLAGRSLEAFDRFYAQDCVMIESGMEPFVGKDFNRQREEDFYGKVTEFRDARLEHASVEADVSYSIWHFDFVHEEWGEQKFQQVAVRRWRDGEVVEERFYRG